MLLCIASFSTSNPAAGSPLLGRRAGGGLHAFEQVIFLRGGLRVPKLNDQILLFDIPR